MPTKPRKPLGRQAGKSPKLPKGADKLIKKLRADLKDATKKLTVHQDPKSKMSASLRSLMDQPRKKVPKSPHVDKKKSKYAGMFKPPTQKKRPKGKT